MTGKQTRTFAIALSSIAMLALVALLSGCAAAAPGGSGTTAAPAAKPSAASAPAPTIRLVTPLQGAEVVAGNVEVKVDTTNLEFVMPSNTVVPGQGHVHFMLDSQPVKMSAKPDYVFEGVGPGQHTLKAELVHNDAKPFTPPIEEEITFLVK